MISARRTTFRSAAFACAFIASSTARAQDAVHPAVTFRAATTELFSRVFSLATPPPSGSSAEIIRPFFDRCDDGNEFDRRRCALARPARQAEARSRLWRTVFEGDGIVHVAPYDFTAHRFRIVIGPMTAGPLDRGSSTGRGYLSTDAPAGPDAEHHAVLAYSLPFTNDASAEAWLRRNVEDQPDRIKVAVIFRLGERWSGIPHDEGYAPAYASGDSPEESTNGVLMDVLGVQVFNDATHEAFGTFLAAATAPPENGPDTSPDPSPPPPTPNGATNLPTDSVPISSADPTRPILAVLRRPGSRIDACWYQVASRQREGSAERVSVRVGVSGEGRVTDVDVQGASSLTLQACIAAAVRAMTFPVGAPASVETSFEFSPVSARTGSSTTRSPRGRHRGAQPPPDGHLIPTGSGWWCAGAVGDPQVLASNEREMYNDPALPPEIFAGGLCYRSQDLCERQRESLRASGVEAAPCTQTATAQCLTVLDARNHRQGYWFCNPEGNSVRNDSGEPGSVCEALRDSYQRDNDGMGYDPPAGTPASVRRELFPELSTCGSVE